MGQLLEGLNGTLDVAKFLGGLPFGRFHIQLLVICSLVTFFDGLDFALIAYTLPYIRDEMVLTAEQMGDVSMAAFIGQMIGSLVGSFVGSGLSDSSGVGSFCAGSSVVVVPVWGTSQSAV